MLVYDFLELVGVKFENFYRINWDGSVMGCSFDIVFLIIEGRLIICDVFMYLLVEVFW